MIRGSAPGRADLVSRLAAALSGAKPPPARLGVAVSGGGDSMALLDLTLLSAAESNAVEAVTVDHGLRPESEAEATFVADRCAALGIPHETLRWGGWDGRGNLPEQAREARYALIAGWARRRQLDAVLLGHTSDDVAETFLMRLSRAAGVGGLARMAAAFELHGVRFLRPLLDVSRDELRTHLAARGLDWREDPSNDDLRRARTRARAALEALEALELGPETLAQVAAQVGQARDALVHYTRAEAEKRAQQDRGDLLLRLAPPQDLPEEIARRLLAGAVQWVGGAPHPPRREALRGVAAALAQGDTCTLSGCVLSAEPGGAVRVTREWSAVRDLQTPTDAVWDGRWRLSGPHASDLRVRALGEAVADCPGWRDTGLPRRSLLAAPAVWRGETLVSAPLAGLVNGWSAALAEPRRDFVASLQ